MQDISNKRYVGYGQHARNNSVYRS
jgi:hypothetical protein